MESIKQYFQNLLIGLAILILSSFQATHKAPTNQSSNKLGSKGNLDDDSDYHMFI